MVGEPVPVAPSALDVVVGYALVSSADQLADLDRQVARVTVWATGQQLALVAQGRRLLVVDSGMNYAFGHSDLQR